MNEEGYKFVDFHKYCPLCVKHNAPETDDICRECLAEPVNMNSEKPVNWKEK